MSEMIKPSRRGFLTGLGTALIIAPAIVRAGSLMPVKQMFDPERAFLDFAHRMANPPLLDMGDGIWELNYDYAMNQIVRILHVPAEYLK